VSSQDKFLMLWELSNDLSNGKFVKNISIYPSLQVKNTVATSKAKDVIIKKESYQDLTRKVASIQKFQTNESSKYCFDST
jgi:hypothetical protein